jgi:hypothetical protein
VRLRAQQEQCPTLQEQLNFSAATIDLRQSMQTQNELGFFPSLFDFKMTNFITMRVIRLLYAISAVLIVIAGAIAMIAGLMGSYGGGSAKVLVVIFVPLGTLLYLIIVRLWVEFLANLYRIGDNTQKMVNALPAE